MKKNAEAGPLLRMEQAAAYLCRSPKSLESDRAKLKEPGILGFRAGGMVLFRREDLDAWLEGQRQAHIAEVEYRRARLEELAS